MIYGCLYIFLIFAVLGSPLWIQIVFAIINIAIPDPIPAIDEMIQVISIMSRINKTVIFYNKIKSSPTYIAISIIITILLIVSLYFIFDEYIQ